MPKGFNELEKQSISESLLNEGRRLFSTYGLKKTSIKDITSAVGIAQGSFYIFYSSKEELYFDILEQEEQTIKEQFLNVKIDKAKNPKKALKDLLLHVMKLIDNNALIRQLYVDNNMVAILRKLPKERLEDHLNKDSDAILPLIQKWQLDGVIIQKNPEVIAGLFRSLFLLTLHKEEIGIAVFDQTLELFIDLIVNGMVIQEG
jgi:AcrR family transcriptional regulator